MKRFALPSTLMLAAALAAACTQDNMSTGPSTDTAQLAKGNTDTDPRAMFDWVDKDGHGIRPDGRFLKTIADPDPWASISTTVSRYENGICGVTSKIFASDGASGDAVNNPVGSSLTKSQKATCTDAGETATPRSISLIYRNPSDPTKVVATETGGWFHNVNDAWHIIPDGATKTDGEFGWHAGTYCDFTNYGRAAGSDKVHITRRDVLVNGVAKRTWYVRSQGNHMAYCKKQNALFYMPFELVVREK